MFKVFEQALDEVVQSEYATTLSRAEVPILVHTRTVASTIVVSEMSNTEYIVPNAETIEKVVERCV